MANKKYEDANAQDPMSEPTLNRRLWALYLRAGYSRGTFAAALGVGYNVVSYWDTGRNVMSLAHLLRACELLKVSVDAVAFGRGAVMIERSLSPDELRALLDEAKANNDQCEALGEYARSARGHMQRMTPTFVRTFLAAYQAERDDGTKEADAIKRAATEAAKARARLDAMTTGGSVVSAKDVKQAATKAARKPRTQRKAVARVPTARPEPLKH